MSLGAKTATGVLWNFSEQLMRRGVGILVTLLLARLLAPEDFGLLAMMAVFIALGQSLMESGFRQALIRMPEVTQTDYNTAFFANIALGTVAYIILAAAAPLIADFYEEERLVALVRVASLAVLVNSLQSVQVASLSRKLNFKAQLKAALPASVISGLIALVLAYLGLGVWALVAQMLLNAVLHTLLLWRIEGWRPTREFSVPALKDMYNFGYKLFLAGFLDTVFKNLYVVIIAKIFSASTAGLYYFANQIKTLVLTQLVASIQTVTYPALAALQDSDERLKAGYKKVVSVMTFVLFPAMLFLAVLAELLFNLLLPEKWFDAIPLLQLLCLAGLLYPLHATNLNILKVKGRSDIFLVLEIIKKIQTVVVILLSVPYGIYGLVVGQIINSVLVYIPNSYYSARLASYPMKEQIGDFLPALLLACTVAAAGFYFVHVSVLPLFATLLIAGLGMGVVYLAIAFLCKMRALSVGLSLVQSRLRRS